MGPWDAADVVEILAVAQRLGHDELVQACAAAEHQLVAEQRVVRDLDDEPRRARGLVRPGRRWARARHDSTR